MGIENNINNVIEGKENFLEMCDKHLDDFECRVLNKLSNDSDFVGYKVIGGKNHIRVGETILGIGFDKDQGKELSNSGKIFLFLAKLAKKQGIELQGVNGQRGEIMITKKESIPEKLSNIYGDINIDTFTTKEGFKKFMTEGGLKNTILTSGNYRENGDNIDHLINSNNNIKAFYVAVNDYLGTPKEDWDIKGDICNGTENQCIDEMIAEHRVTNHETSYANK